jgi:mono/diheme cytochrome c family protein
MKRLVTIILLLATAPAAFPAEQTPSVEKNAAAGRLLIGKLSCTACHAASEPQAKWLSAKKAPRLGDIGGRASAEWLKQYLASPQETMPGTTMPDMLDSLPAAERVAAAESLTHYLLSQQTSRFKRVMPDRAAVARGQALYHSVGCVACHAPQTADVPATAPSTGSLAGSVPLPRMAEKWSFDGLRRFLLDPLASRPSGRMPSMRLTDGEAADIAHYLLRETRVPAALELAVYRGDIRALDDIDSAELARTGPADGFVLDAGVRSRAAQRFLGWLRIDTAGDYTFYFSASGAARLAIDGEWIAGDDSWEREKVDAKVTRHLDSGWHAIKVDYVHRGEKPPALKLEWEGPGVTREPLPASRLQSDREAVPEPPTFVVDPAKAAAGRSLYEKLNCAACHDAKPAGIPTQPLTAVDGLRGCLAEAPPGNTPDFHLDVSQRNAIAAAVRFLNGADLPAPGATEQLADAMATFNCTACHVRDGTGGITAGRDRFFTSNGQDLGDEGRIPPRLDGVGNKLKLDWLMAVFTGGASVRPYLNTRMPQFGRENVGQLPRLLVSIDRKPQELAAVADDPGSQREAGRKIVGTTGLSCIACHRFNNQPAQTLQVIDLTTSTQRLNEDWFRQFLLDPNHFHPGTRMPAFWPGGKSALTTVLGGNTARQHAALWTYVADGAGAKFPEGVSRENLELIVGGEAVVYRGKLWEAGYRAVAMGYPGQFNAAFDAEEMRLSLLWHGRFLNAGPHWTIQGMGLIRPLGTDVVVFPHGSPLAVLADANAPWPAEASKALGMKFRGYQLDALKRPTLLYAFRNAGLEDFLAPIEGNAKSGLRRTVKFTDPVPDDLYLRLAVGKLTARGENAWRLNDAITLSVSGAGKPFTRGTGDKSELLVPIRFTDKSSQLEVEYVW